MNKKVDFPENALPLASDLLAKVQSYQSKELYWLSGYCSGLADAKQANSQIGNPVSTNSDAVVELKTVVLYGSQTGNAQELAESLYQSLTQKGLKPKLSSLADFKPNQLKDQQVVLLVTSTHGEGEAPDDAIDFHEFIQGKRAPKLAGVRHAVLGLGDSSYEFFCQTAKDFDNAFSKLGSQPLVERVDCDLDYAEPASQWINKVLDEVSVLSGANNNEISALSPMLTSGDSGTLFTKDKPFTATILLNQKITARDSVKHINHIELSIEGSGIQYQPGDSLGIWAKNQSQIVDEILQLTELTGDESVTIKQVDYSLKKALTEKLELSLINKGFVSDYAALTGSESVKNIQENNFSQYIKVHQIVDILKLSPLKLEAQKLVELLKPIKPRMYSIASSLDANPDEVHITVGLKKSDNDLITRYGVASYYLLETLKEDDEVFVFVETNKHFKLPDNDKPAIMIGPGTGIAPFRSFLQQREEDSAEADNWLFFGNPNFNTDFLYQVELQKFLKSGLLTHLNVAFSRDQEQKIYVQDRLLENATAIWQWISQQQAYVYVCGDMNRMAKDVHAALVKIVIEQGNKSPEEAELFLKQLKKENRYQRDVY